MAFENLSERLQNTIAKLTGKGKVSEADVKEMMREVRLALLEADVNFKVVKEFVKKISERAVGTEVMKSLTPAQQVVKIVNEELVELLGGSNVELNQGGKITTVMMVGLQAADVVPRVATGTATGLTGLFGYLLGSASAGYVMGKLVDVFGWNGGFYALIVSCVLAFVFISLTLFKKTSKQLEN